METIANGVNNDEEDAEFDNPLAQQSEPASTAQPVPETGPSPEADADQGDEELARETVAGYSEGYHSTATGNSLFADTVVDV